MKRNETEVKKKKKKKEKQTVFEPWSEKSKQILNQGTNSRLVPCYTLQ